MSAFDPFRPFDLCGFTVVQPSAVSKPGPKASEGPVWSRSSHISAGEKFKLRHNKRAAGGSHISGAN